MAQHSKNSYPAEVGVKASHLVKVKKCISPPPLISVKKTGKKVQYSLDGKTLGVERADKFRVGPGIGYGS